MIILTDRLELRKLNQKDAEVLFSYRSNPEVYRFQGWLPATVQEAERFIENSPIDNTWIPGQWKQLGIFLQEGNILIGDIGIHVLDINQVELGFTIAPGYQKKGYASEAVTAIINTLRVEKGISKFVGVADPENTSSIKLLEKLEFELTEHKVQASEIRGELRDDLVFVMKT